ncbi:MAG: protein kinase [Proteobacteria bacterium]|nr:protein kinase [Pseudomonadota bacterium]
MSDRISTFRLDRTTSPKRLDEFLAGEGALSKVRGEKNADGSVTLFISDRATGLWGQLTGFSKQRETARTALDRWFRFQYGPNLPPEAKDALKGRMDVRNVRLLVHDMQVNDKPISKDDWVLVPPEPFPHTGAPPPPMGAKQVLQEQEVQVPRDGLPRHIQIDHNQPPQDIDVQIERDQFPRDGVLTPGENGSIRPPRKLAFNGEEYTIQPKRLGNGAESNVYEGVNARGEKIALKVPNRDKVEEAEREFLVHQRAVGSDRDLGHIVGLKGAATDSKGRIQALVLEHMPGGDAKNLLTQLRNAERDGKIGVEKARLIRLTIARDMATGLTQLHQARSLLHFDIKPDNFLIGRDGVAKLSDFGTVRPEGEMQGRTTAEFRGTAQYVSPEAFGARGKIEALDEEIRRLESRPTELGFTKEALTERAKELREQIDKTSIDAKSDVFSLGLSLTFAFAGKSLGGLERSALKDVQSLGEGDGPARDDVLNHLGITGDSPEHQLIRTMLAPNPEDRPTAQEVLDRLPFDDQIGSPEIRELLYNIARGEFPPEGHG